MLEKKKIKNGNGFLYEYSNGLKVFYKKKDKTQIAYMFLTGDNMQKIGGLAHFVEHSLFLDEKLSSIYGNDVNASVGNNITSIVFYNMDKDVEIIKNGESEEKDKESIKSIIETNIGLAFSEINGTGWSGDYKQNNFTFEKFENEKKVIDKEWAMKSLKLKDSLSLRSLFSDYITNKDKLFSCGNYNTLKNVTLDDVIEYKKKNFILQNFIFEIETPLNYEDIEDIVVSNIMSNIRSDEKSKNEFIEHKNDIMKNAYYVKNYERDAQEIDFYILFDNQVSDEEKDIMDWLFFVNNLNGELEKVFRREQGLVYFAQSFKEDPVAENKCISLYASTTKEDTKKYLLTVANVCRNILDNNMQMENFYKVKKYIQNAQRMDVRDVDEIAEEIWKGKKDPITIENNVKEKINNMDINDFNNMIDEVKKHINIAVVMQGQIQASDLPSIDMLADIIKGKNVDRKNYPQNMSQDKDKHSKIISLDTRMTKALVPVQEREM